MGNALQPAIQLLSASLDFLYQLTRDYGLAIVLLTLGIRVALLPLTIKQTRSMMEMQKIQPKLKEIQKKYKKDKQKMQEEMMKVYQENKVNPMGGCLPMLIQLPVMLALFWMLKDNVKVQQANFLFLLPELGKAASDFSSDLVAGIPYIVLMVLVVVSTYLPQKMMTSETQQQQQAVMIGMTVLMAFFAWGLPAGVLVYWVTTNIWTIAQQWLMVRYAQAEGA